jgi:hypothetical protein
MAIMRRRSKKKQRWGALSPTQQKATVGAGIVQVALCIAALADIRRRPADQINGKKPMWVALAFVNTIGPLAYFAFGRKR